MNKLLRFNKTGDNLTYPITQEQIDDLQDSDLVNPFTADDPRVLLHPNELPTPPMPEDGEPYWRELVNVAQAVHLAKTKEKFDTRESNEWSLFDSGNLMKGKPYISECLRRAHGIRTADQLAELVRADYPTRIINDLVIELKRQGAKIDRELFTKKGYKVFTDGLVMISHMTGWAIHTVSPTAFAHKYYWGCPRPEEVIHAWANNEYKVSPLVNDQLEHLVNKEQAIKDARTFTMYKEGSPNHPSNDAMHAAVSAIAVTIPAVLNLDPIQVDECVRTSSNISYGRTFAGVHFENDNLRGLELGERVMEKILPKWLAQWGANEEAVKLKIALYRNNWM